MCGLEKELAFRALTPCHPCQATGMQVGTYYQDCPVCGGRGRRWSTPGQLQIGALCEACQGHGKVMTHPCPHCGGQGHRLEWKKYHIVIPPGVEDGARILINGQGGAGFQQGPPGHLVVVVHVEAHAFFTRHNNNLHGALEVSFAQAVLGDTIKIPTLSGPRLLELPRGTQSGQSFVFPGLGVPANGSGHPGDLLITVHITKKARFPDAEALGNPRQTRSEQH
jgi:molecular chaperone DnaJ